MDATGDSCPPIAEPASPRSPPAILQQFAKVMNHAMANQRGNQGDREIRERKNIAAGKDQSFPLSIGRGKFSHQQVGIKEEDNKRNLNQGAPDPGPQPTVFLA